MNLPLLCDQAIRYHQGGNLAEAERLYLQILAVEPANFLARHLLGVIRYQQGRYAEALELIGAALKINPNVAEALLNYGNVLKALDRLGDALASYNKALTIKPGYAEALNNRGNMLWYLKRFEEALASYDEALTIKPDYAVALNNRGNTLRDLKRFEEALASYDKALAIKPDYTEAWENYGKALWENDHSEEGFAAITRHAALFYGSPASPHRSNERTPPHKVRHDREQRDYLAGDQARDDPMVIGATFRLEDGGRLATPAVNPDNAVGDIAEQWQTSKPQIVVIDNLLTDEALDKLRRFCWGSTVWRKVYNDGYLGAMPENGFACPLLAQIANELRDTFPTILGAHPLLYLWGFKYDSQLTGIKIHADEAAVNVNFWITSDEANLDPESGGLVIWDVAAPLDWDFAQYNRNVTAIREFITHSGARPVTIPYRANRAVIFDSDLFHETDKIAFKDGYLNRRINVTLLYGRRSLIRVSKSGAKFQY